MKSVTDVDFSSGIIWAASDGGAFGYSFTDNEFQTFTNAEGLRGISLTSLMLDNSGRKWFGSQNGVIDVYNDEDESFSVILDVANSNQVNKSINHLDITSDTIIVSTDFGVSLIDGNTLLFLDTFRKFGNFTADSKVNHAQKYDLFYVCTDEGVAVQKAGSTNLSAPESWNTYSNENGLPADKAIKIVNYRDTIVVATNSGFASFYSTQWLPFLQQFNNSIISDVITSGDSLFILSENIIYLYYNGILLEIYSSSIPVNRISLNKNLGLACASSNGILYLTPKTSASYIFPNGPAANQFPSLSVDNTGKLWSASGQEVTGVGFYTYDKVTWNNYNVDNTPQMPHNGVYYAYTSPDNIGYLGTWGFGFIRTDTETFDVFNRANSGMQGIPANTDYVVVTGFGNDSRNNLWILNLWASDRRTLSMLTPDSLWYHFLIPAAQNLTLNNQENLAVDAFDTKWFSSDDASRRGVFYFNEMKTYDNASDDRSGFLTTLNGLTNNEILSIKVDKRGDVWIGTGLGVTVISNTNSITSPSSSSLRITSVFALRQQAVNAIAIDPLNQKWVGTNQGLLLVNSDGSRLLAAYDTKNSPLLSDRIISVAVDENGGIVYAGTENSLTSFETPFIKPKEEFDELFIYPNPYFVDNSSNLLTIDGLIRDSDIKILTLSGKLISEFSSPGGRTAFWDGRDDEGNLVNSGVYIVVAFDSEGNSTVTGKVAVLRR
ncbi:MAG: two-component regulator propeller domain-containing protein [Ignavibacteriaceae bacterium]